MPESSQFLVYEQLEEKWIKVQLHTLLFLYRDQTGALKKNTWGTIAPSSSSFNILCTNMHVATAFWAIDSTYITPRVHTSSVQKSQLQRVHFEHSCSWKAVSYSIYWFEHGRFKSDSFFLFACQKAEPTQSLPAHSCSTELLFCFWVQRWGHLHCWEFCGWAHSVLCYRLINWKLAKWMFNYKSQRVGKTKSKKMKTMHICIIIITGWLLIFCHNTFDAGPVFWTSHQGTRSIS